MYPDNLHIEPTKRTPWIVLEHRRIFIMGRSIIDNPGVFYEPVHQWIKDYVMKSKGRTRVELGFDYINSGSTKWLYILLRELSGMEDLTHKTSVTWYYEEGDEDIFERGEYFSSVLKIPFNFIRIT